MIKAALYIVRKHEYDANEDEYTAMYSLKAAKDSDGIRDFMLAVRANSPADDLLWSAYSKGRKIKLTMEE